MPSSQLRKAGAQAEAADDDEAATEPLPTMTKSAAAEEERAAGERKSRETLVDGPWAWVVTASTFVVHFILYGFIFITGIYFVIFLETFRRSSSETSWVGSLYMGVLCCTGPVAGIIINKWGCRTALLVGTIISSTGQLGSAFATDVRHMFFTLGLLTGFGHGLLLMASVVALNLYFVRYRVLALGISLLGTAAGNIVYPYITRYLIEGSGWRGALIYSSGINLQCCVAAMFVRPIAQHDENNSSSKKAEEANSSDLARRRPRLVLVQRQRSIAQTTLALCKDMDYWLLCASNVTFVFGISIFVTHIAAFAKWVGINERASDHLLSSLGVAGLMGRVLTAMIAHHRRVNIILFLVACYVLAGLGLFSYGSNRTFAGMLVSVLVYGFFSATNGSVSAEYASLVIGSESFATGYGYVMLCNGFGAVGGAPVAGLLYDKTRFYPASLYLAASLMVLSGLLMLPTYFTFSRQGRFSPITTTRTVIAEAEESAL